MMLVFVEAHFHLQLTTSYISTGDNNIVDDLSRNRIILFRSKMPQADSIPTPIPPSLPSLLFNPRMDWVSPAWTEQFSNAFNWG